jgi:hypothetical protein
MEHEGRNWSISGCCLLAYSDGPVDMVIEPVA